MFRPGNHADLDRRRRCRRRNVSRAAGGLVYAAVHREDIDQAAGFQHPAHGRLRGGERKVTTASASPFPYPQQHRQTAIADALQARQVNDDRRPAGRHGRDQMGSDPRGVGQVKLAAQSDHSPTVGGTDTEAHVKHGFPRRSGKRRASGPRALGPTEGRARGFSLNSSTSCSRHLATFANRSAAEVQGNKLKLSRGRSRAPWPGGPRRRSRRCGHVVKWTRSCLAPAMPSGREPGEGPVAGARTGKRPRGCPRGRHRWVLEQRRRRSGHGCRYGTGKAARTI